MIILLSLWMEIEPMIIAIHRQYARVHQLIHGAGPNFDKLKAGFTLSGIAFAHKNIVANLIFSL